MRLRPARLALAAVLTLSPGTRANDVTWTNGAGGFSWSNGAANYWSPFGNWDNGFTDSAIFTSTGAGTVTVNSAITLRAINFQANGYTIGGTNTLTFANGGLSALGLTPGEIRVNLGVAATINAPIGGSVGLTKTGTGTLILGGANSFTGTTFINAGTLSISSNANLGGTTAGIAFNGGTLRFTGTGTTSISGSRATTLGSSGGTIDTAGLGVGGGNVFTYASPITGNGPLTLNAHGDLTDSGGGSNSELFLTGANTFLGTVTIGSGLVDASSNFGNASNAITINGGGLLASTATPTISRNITLGGTGTFRAFNGATLTLSGSISGTGNLRKTDSGTVVLGGANSFTGGLNVNAGVLTFTTGTSSLSTGPGSGEFIADTGTLNIIGGANVTNRDATIRNGGSITVGGTAGTVWTNNSGFLRVGQTGTGTLSITGGGAVTSGSVSIGVNTGTTGVVNIGGGVGTSSLTTGTLTVGQNGPGTLNITTGGTATASALEGGFGTSSVNFNGGTLNITGTDTAGNTITLAGNGTIGVPNAGTTFTISSAISGSGSLTKTGAGTLTLPGGNAYTGGTTVTGGTLNFDGGQSGATGTVTVNAGATLQFSRSDVYGVHTTTNGNIIVNSATVTNDLNRFNTLQNLTLNDGTLGGTGGVGSQLTTWSVRGTVTSTGTSVINPGGGNGWAGFTLGQDGDTTFDVQSGTLTIATRVVDNRVSVGTQDLPGFLTKTGSGTLILSAAGTYTGGTTINGGTLQLGATNALPTGTAVTITAGTLNLANFNQTIASLAGSGGTVALGGGDLTVNGAASTTYAGAIDGGGLGSSDLIRAGTGTLALTGTSTYGQTLVQGGTLVVTGAGIVTTSQLSVGGSGNPTLSITGGGTYSGGNISIGGSSGETGTVSVGGGAGLSNWTNVSILYVGGLGTGTVNVTGGGSVSSSGSIFNIGHFGSGSGTVNVGGGSGAANWTHAGVLTVGSLSTGTLNIMGGGTVALTGGSAGATIGDQSGSTGTVNVGGGIGASAWTNTGALIVGNSGTGVLNVNAGGTVTASALDGGNATSSVNFNGGTLRITGTDTASNTINLLAGGGTIGVPTAGTTFTITSAISGAGSLTKSGVGTLTLTNAGNNFGGGLIVAQGTLSVASDAVLGATLQPVTVQPLGTLNYTASTITGRTYNLTTGSLRAASGTTLTFANAAVGGGFLSGTFATQSGTSNTFAGTTTAASASLALSGTNTLMNFNHGGQLTANAGSTTTLTTFYTLPSGQVTVPTGAAVTVQDFQSSGVLNITGTGVVTRSGTSPIVLGGGSTTFLGSQVSRGGTINLGGGTLQVRGGLLVNAGLTTSAGGVINGQTVVDYGGLAKGDGFYADIVAINGGKISGGFSPGTLNAGTLNLNGGRSPGVTGGTFVFEVTDPGPSAAFPSAPGTAGGATGWDTVSAGRVRFTATPADPFTVSLVTLRPAGDVPGLIPNFDPTRAYSWRLIDNPTGVVVDADGNAAVIDPAAVRIDASGFQNPTDGGTFGLSVSGDQRLVYLTFTPVPEPAHVLLVCAAAVGLVAGLRRRTHAAG